MKILVIYQYFGTPKGSWSTRMYEVCRRWVLEGVDVEVITAPYEKSDIRTEHFIDNQEIEGIRLTVINSGDNNRLSTPHRALRAMVFSFFSMYFTLTRKYDILISSSGPITVGLPMILAKVLRRKKSVFEVRDLWPLGGIEMGKIKNKYFQQLGLWFERKCYEKSDLIVTASSGQAANISQRLPQYSPIVMPQGADNEIFGITMNKSLPSMIKGKQMFVHIGSLGLIHNCILHVKAAKWLQENSKDNIIIVLIGDGAERRKLEEYTRKHQLKNVFFIGLLPKKELVPWVQGSIATLFSTLDNPVQHTSSPNKIMDSFAAGVPIIQNTTGWIYELVEKEECGINVPPENPEAFARAMVKLTQDSALQSKLATNAKRLAETTFNRDRIAAEMLQAIRRIYHS